MISQERAAAQLYKHQLAPGIGQEDFYLTIFADANFARQDHRIAHHQFILLGQRVDAIENVVRVLLLQPVCESHAFHCEERNNGCDAALNETKCRR
jgi:hypothetical protein